LRIPYAKGGYWQDENSNRHEARELETDFAPEQLDSLRKNLHNVLWGGGGTDDNEIFASLVNLILAKIQDEVKKKKGKNMIFKFFTIKMERKLKAIRNFLNV